MSDEQTTANEQPPGDEVADQHPGVAADDPGADHGPGSPPADRRQAGEADAPVDYAEGSDAVDELTAQAMARMTESPEAHAATDDPSAAAHHGDAALPQPAASQGPSWG
ncbi:MAG TPA: hypothetical protein VG452_02935, partial [Egibacteraceae bacterium]|nr:hypothetical protein [Egibacteraceae bacterium]